jgi:hypothetical protein
VCRPATVLRPTATDVCRPATVLRPTATVV